MNWSEDSIGNTGVTLTLNEHVRDLVSSKRPQLWTT